MVQNTPLGEAAKEMQAVNQEPALHESRQTSLHQSSSSEHTGDRHNEGQVESEGGEDLEELAAVTT